MRRQDRADLLDGHPATRDCLNPASTTATQAVNFHHPKELKKTRVSVLRRASDGRSPLLNHRAAAANVPIRIRIALILLPAIAMVLPGTVVVAQPDAIPRVQALRSAHGGTSDTTLRELRSIAERKDSTVLATRIEALLADQSLEPAARERLLETGAILLGGLAPDAKARRLLERISKLEPQTWVWLEEGGHRAAVPLYDPAAAARVAERGWRAREYETRLLAKLAAGEQGLIDDLARARPAERTGALSAVAAHLTPRCCA